jgi:hydrogenase maturation factor
MEKQILSEEFRRMQKLAGILNEEKQHQKQMFKVGDSIVVNNTQNLPKGYENLKKGDKIVVTKVWKNANDGTVLYSMDNNENGMDNEDVLAIK